MVVGNYQVNVSSPFIEHGVTPLTASSHGGEQSGTPPSGQHAASLRLEHGRIHPSLINNTHKYFLYFYLPCSSFLFFCQQLCTLLLERLVSCCKKLVAVMSELLM